MKLIITVTYYFTDVFDLNNLSNRNTTREDKIIQIDKSIRSPTKKEYS